MGRENFASPWPPRGFLVVFLWWPRCINRRKVSKFHENSQIEVEGRACYAQRRRGGLASMGCVGSRRAAASQGRGHAGGCALRGGPSRSLPGFAPLPRSLPGSCLFAPQPARFCPFPLQSDLGLPLYPTACLVLLLCPAACLVLLFCLAACLVLPLCPTA